MALRHPGRVGRVVLLAPSLAWRRERPWAPLVRVLSPELGLVQVTPRWVVEAIVHRILPVAQSTWIRAGVDEFLRAYLTPRGRVVFYAAARQIYLEEPHEALSAAGYETLHRSLDAANYRGRGATLIGVDVLYARRPATLAMLGRAAIPAGGGDVPVVDVEGLIGLKLQALVNDPTRRRRDEADIVALLTLHLPSLDRALLDEYFALFDRRDDLARFLDEAGQRRG